MGCLQMITWLLMLATLNKLVKTRLACQQEVRVQPTGIVVINQTASTTNIPTTTTSSVPSSTAHHPFAKPNQCCGNKPFSSEAAICCLGKVINKSKRKCCLDGTNVPSESRCLCYPTSDWLIEELNRLVEIESVFTSLIEILSDRLNNELQQQITMAEENLEYYDGKANELYQEFLKEIDIARNTDPAEVDYIINLVTFLNTNEANIDNARKSLDVLEEVSQEMLDHVQNDDASAGNVEENSSENVAMPPETLRRIRREIEAMDTTIETANALVDLVRQEINTSLSQTSNKENIERLILQRNNVLRNSTREQRNLRILRDRRTILARIMSILEADRNLLSSLRSFLDALLDEVFSMESALREELQEMMEEEEEEMRIRSEQQMEGLSRRRRSLDDEKEDDEEARRIIYPGFPNRPPPPFLLQPPPDRPTPAGSSQMLPSPVRKLPVDDTSSIDDNASPTMPTPEEDLSPVSTQKPATTIAIPRITVPSACDFSAWDDYINTFVRRAGLVELDLEELETSATTDNPITFIDLEHVEDHTGRSSRTDEHFISTGHGSLSSSRRKLTYVRKKRSIAPMQYDDDAINTERWRSLRVYRDFTSYAWLADFKNFQLSDSFLGNITQFISHKNLGLLGIP